MKKNLILTCVLAFIVVIIVSITYGPYVVRKHLAHHGEPIKVEIPQGASASKIADILKENGVIKYPLFFRLCLKVSDSGSLLRSGVFDLYKEMSSVKAIWHLINDSGTPNYKVRILEGWRIEEIAEELYKEGIIEDAGLFIALAKDTKSEGYLFPSTYQLPKKMTPQAVLGVMKDEYNKQIAPLIAEANSNLTENEILTVASIVEREAVLNAERPKIAAVYLNRIKIGKRLEADPTVQYAIGYCAEESRHWKKGLTYADLRVDSPYNTYRYEGLPPTPIANPGVSSVKAVLNPMENFDALYFVADNETGGHIFSKTYHQHLETVKAVRAKTKEKEKTK